MHDILYWFDSKQVFELKYRSMFYGYFPINLIRSYIWLSKSP